MKNYRILYFIYCLILFLSLDLKGQELQQQIDAIVQNHIDATELAPGYNILVSKQGETIYQNSIGYANISARLEMTPQQVFRIASITKQFTASAILQLEQEGKLSLTDDIGMYVNGYPAYGSDVTIHHLLAHTSGIPNRSDIENFDKLFINKSSIKPLQIITAFKDAEKNFQAGEKLSYNNFGYIVLGYIIQKVSGLSYRDYLAQEYFIPLKMNATSYLDKKYEPKDLTVGYKKTDNGYIKAEDINLQLAFSAGGLISNLEDIATWYNYVYQSQAINETIFKTALAPKTTEDGLSTGYGYGWQTGSFRGRDYFGHDGIINGFNSDTRYFVDDELFIAVLSNCEGNGATRLLRKISNALLTEHKNIVEFDKLSPEYANKLTGEYELRPGFVIQISKVGEKIFGMPNGQAKVELKPLGGSKFYVQEIEAEIEFRADDDGAVNSFTLVQGGQENYTQRINK